MNQVIPSECENAKRSIRLVRLFLFKREAIDPFKVDAINHWQTVMKKRHIEKTKHSNY